MEAIIPRISKDSKMIYCCLTSSNAEHEGHIFYLLLKYLANEQNKLLEAAEQMIAKENEYGLSNQNSGQQVTHSDSAFMGRQVKKTTINQPVRDRERHHGTKTEFFPRTHIIELKKD